MSGDLDQPARPFSKQQQTRKSAEPRRFRKVASKDRWAQIIAAKGSVCRLCQFVEFFPERARELGVSKEGCEGLPVSYHHLWNRSRGGSDTNANVVPLGGSGTTGHHGAVTARRAPELRALAETLSDAEIAYLAQHAGEAWPERVFGVTFS